MTQAAEQLLPTIELNYVPASEQEDKYSPLQDQYVQSVHRLQREVAAKCAEMPPKHVEVVRKWQAGMTQVDICKELDVQTRYCSQIIKKKRSQELMALMHLLRARMDGPNFEQRMNMLWRISVDNESERPKTAITALAEINKMVLGTAALGDGTGQVNIIIQNGVLAKGVLDV
jgi:hypothetical protein